MPVRWKKFDSLNSTESTPFNFAYSCSGHRGRICRVPRFYKLITVRVAVRIYRLHQTKVAAETPAIGAGTPGSYTRFVKGIDIGISEKGVLD